MVLLDHSETVIPAAQAGVFRPFVTFCGQFGWTGVNLFFVLSGYLIGGLLFKEIKITGHLDVRRFIVRRGLKIWPSYYLLLGWLILQAYRTTHSLHAALLPLLPNLLHIQSYWHTPQEFTWSLAVEEHFYLALPLLLLLLARSRKMLDRFPVLFAVVAVACLTLRCLAVIRYPHPPSGEDYSLVAAWVWHVATPTHLRIDELLFGVLLAYLTYFRPEKLEWIADSPRNRWGLALTGIALLSPMWFLDNGGAFVHSIGITMLAMGYSCLLLACVHARAAEDDSARVWRNLPVRFLAWVGFFSYPIYLWHMNQGSNRVAHLLYTGRLAHMGASARWIAATGLYLLFAIGFGMLFSLLLEKPTLAFRDRFFPDKAGAPA